MSRKTALFLPILALTFAVIPSALPSPRQAGAPEASTADPPAAAPGIPPSKAQGDGAGEAPSGADPDALTAERAAAAAALGELPAPPEDGGQDPDAARRDELTRRVAALDKHLGALRDLARSEARTVALDDRGEAATARLAEVDALSPPEEPASPTVEGLQGLREEAGQLRARIEELDSRQDEVRGFREGRPSLVAAERAIASAAESALAEGEVEGADGKRPLAEVELAAAAARIAALEAEAAYHEAADPVRALERDAAARRLARVEEEIEVYDAALERSLAAEQDAKRRELAAAEAAAENAESASERYLARLRASRIETESNALELSNRLTALQKEVSHQQALLQQNTRTLDNLVRNIGRSGVTGAAAERLKTQHRRLPEQRARLALARQSRLLADVPALQDRQFEIDDTLEELSSTDTSARDEIVAELPPEEAAAFRVEAAELVKAYKAGLGDERTAVAEVVGAAQGLEEVLLERARKLDELERFLLKYLLRIRDGTVIGVGFLDGAAREYDVVRRWASALPETGARLATYWKEPRTIVVGLLMLLVLPVALFRIRQGVRRFVTARNDRTLDRGTAALDLALAVGGGLLSAALLPAWLFAGAHAVDLLDLPAGVASVLATSLRQASVLLFLWFVARSFFAGRSISHVQLKLNLAASHSLYGALRVAILAWASLLVPWMILRAPPLVLSELPRFLYTAFELVAAGVLLHLLRRRSPFVKHGVASDPRSLAARYWRVFHGAAILLVLAVVVLDVLGYRYGALQLAIAFLKSLVTLLLAWPLFLWASDAIVTLARRRARRRRTPGDDVGSESALASEPQIRRIIRVGFAVATLLLLAGHWGIDEQAFGALDDVGVYAVSGPVVDGKPTAEWVSAADILLFLVFLAGTMWVLRLLPTLLEIGVFPRFELDSGLRYAITTISRYAVFAIGVVAALSAIHLDLGRLGWLIAAMGVGLGFGLQEIVSNLVSGIILLLERPIRVGDVVTIGATSGTIKRINIRATTVVNFDQQEVIVPNRQLITGEVTNWTGSNKILRLVVPIGVAYGTDPDAVTAALTRVVGSQPDLLKEPAPQVLFLAHGASSLDFEVRAFVPDPGLKMPMIDRLNKAINRELAARGIEIPFPQQDVHLRGAEGLFARFGAEPPRESGGQAESGGRAESGDPANGAARPVARGPADAATDDAPEDVDGPTPSVGA